MRILPLALVLSALVLAACERSPEPVPFERHFQKVRTVRLSQEVFVERVSSIDVTNSGQFLITDAGNGVYRFDTNGELIDRLTAEPCHPGFQMRPQEAYVRSDGSIFMINSSPWGFLFRADGSCWKEAAEDFRPPRQIAFAPGGRIYGWYTRPGANSSRLRVMNGAGETLETHRIPASPYNAVDGRLSNRNGMMYHEKRLYQVLPSQAGARVYDRQGNLVKQIENSPPNYRPITSNIPARFSSGQDFVQKLEHVIEGKTWLQSLYLLSGEKLVLQYVTGWFEEYMIDVLDMKGRRLIDRPIILTSSQRIRQVRQGKVYQVVQPNSTVEGQVPNPRIEVYTFKE